MLLEEDRPRRTFLCHWHNWVLALLLGPLVCISDIRFQAGADSPSDADDAGPFRLALSDSDFFTGDVDDGRVADVPGSDFTPPGEPVLMPFDRIIHEAAGRYDLDPDLIAAVIMAESQFNPGAVSKKGAKGLMQIMPVTAGALDVTNLHSPEENIDGGSRHLRWLIERLRGDTRLALAAYNAGLQPVLTYNGVPPYPETQAYVTKVMEFYSAIKGASLAF
jgi:soluble lytic murein transglycosylase-like protein